MYNEKMQNYSPQLCMPTMSMLFFCGDEMSYKLLCKNQQIEVPVVLTTKSVDWYHNLLCHPGGDHTKNTISQHFYWKGLQDGVGRHICMCPTCQLTKPSNKKYGLLPAKEAEVELWEKLW